MRHCCVYACQAPKPASYVVLECVHASQRPLIASALRASHVLPTNRNPEEAAEVPSAGDALSQCVWYC
eukprot:365234-Chlamydomonas_euryale.AAC.7